MQNSITDLSLNRDLKKLNWAKKNPVLLDTGSYMKLC
jgi:hypothetical protein